VPAGWLEWRFVDHSVPGAALIEITPLQVGAKPVDGGPLTPPDQVPPTIPRFSRSWPHEATIEFDGRDLPSVQDARGWPWLALSCEHLVFSPQTVEEVRTQGGITEWDCSARGGLKIDTVVTPSGAARARALPLRPIWSGFMKCIMLYGGAWFILFMLLSTPSRLRRGRRLRRGECLRCGYDLQGAHEDGCPECGWQRTTPES
jgi:hypothetical protein